MHSDKEHLKTDRFAKNLDLEGLIRQINAMIVSDAVGESKDVKNKTTFPAVFIVGVPRSGTTLVSQVLASTQAFCFPTNFISRFYNAPHLGAMIQEMLFNPRFAYKEELSLLPNSGKFISDVGKTKGPLEPHEFWYFWRRFFEFPEIPAEPSLFEKNADFTGFIQAIQLIQNFYLKPFFIKALIINPYIRSFAKNYENALFLHITRDPIDNAISLLETRRKYYDDPNVWFSFKPKEFELLNGKDPVDQVIGQTFYLNSMIERQLNELPESRKLVIAYEGLCENPGLVLKALAEKLQKWDSEFTLDQFGTGDLKLKSVRHHQDRMIFEKALKEIQ